MCSLKAEVPSFTLNETAVLSNWNLKREVWLKKTVLAYDTCVFSGKDFHRCCRGHLGRVKTRVWPFRAPVRASNGARFSGQSSRLAALSVVLKHADWLDAPAADALHGAEWETRQNSFDVAAVIWLFTAKMGEKNSSRSYEYMYTSEFPSSAIITIITNMILIDNDIKTL